MFSLINTGKINHRINTIQSSYMDIVLKVKAMAYHNRGPKNMDKCQSVIVNISIV